MAGTALWRRALGGKARGLRRFLLRTLRPLRLLNYAEQPLSSPDQEFQILKAQLAGVRGAGPVVRLAKIFLQLLRAHKMEHLCR